MAEFKNLTTGIHEIVENEEVIALMEASDNYEEVSESPVVEKAEKPAKKATKKAEKPAKKATKKAEKPAKKATKKAEKPAKDTSEVLEEEK